jgi:hypothetical protein
MTEKIDRIERDIAEIKRIVAEIERVVMAHFAKAVPEPDPDEEFLRKLDTWDDDL